MKRNFVIVALIFFPALSTIAAEYKVMLQGILVSYDAKTVTLRQGNSFLLKLPSSSVPHKEGLTTGKAYVTAFATPTEITALNPSFLKK